MTSTGSPPFARSLGPLALVAGAFLVNLSSRAVLGPLMPAVEADLGIGHGQAGMVFLFLSLGYCVGLLGAGFVNSRVSHRTTISLSAFIMGVVLLALGVTKTLAGLRTGVFFLGFGAALYLPSGVATVTSLVNPKDWGKALAVHELAPNLGYAVAPLLAEMLLRSVSWRGALSAFGVASLAVGVAFAVFGKGGRFTGQPPNWVEARSLCASSTFWILMLLFALGLGITGGVYAMMPLFLTSEIGFSRGYANGLVAISRASSVVTVFGSGWLTDRLGPRRALMVVLGTSGALTLVLGFAPHQWIVPVAVLQPMAGAWFFPAAFAALSSLGPLAVSFSVPLAVTLGAGVIPAVIGVLGERGAFGLGIALVGGLTVAGAVLASRLPTHPRDDDEAGGVPAMLASTGEGTLSGR